MAFFLDDADQKDDANERDDVEIRFDELNGEERADSRKESWREW